MFSVLALSVHVLGTLIGCWPLARWSQQRNGHSVAGGVGLEEAWIASNAAIGGPATAAAFCMNRMKRERSPQDDQLLQGRTIAATVWGVVGYTIGTMLGIAMYQWTGKDITA